MAEVLTHEREELVVSAAAAAEFAAPKPNGPAAAAILACGIGSAALGILTTTAEVVPAVKTALTLYAPVGPLSGKTIGAVLVWLVAWAILAISWRGKDVGLPRIFTATFVLIGLGVLGTFPIFYQFLAGE